MINTREVAKEYRLSHWARVMRERTESGLSIKAFCRQIGICGNTYYYWQRRLREAACEQLPLNNTVGKNSELPAVSFTEVLVREADTEVLVREPNARLEAPEAGQGLIHIEVGEVRITVDGAYPADKLARMIRELARPC